MEARPFGRRGGLESKAGAVPLWPVLSSEIGLPFWPVVRFLGRPRSCVLFTTSSAWAELLLGSWSMRGPRFMNPTGALEPPGDSGRIV